jgi:hypothetical protein
MVELGLYDEKLLIVFGKISNIALMLVFGWMPELRIVWPFDKSPPCWYSPSRMEFTVSLHCGWPVEMVSPKSTHSSRYLREECSN